MKMIGSGLKSIFTLLLFMLLGCNGNAQQRFSFEKKLPKSLKEISGITVLGKQIWAISDKPSPLVFGLDEKGLVTHEVRLNNITVTDVEAITSDGSNLYVGDLGDNEGDRMGRKIIKISAASLANGAAVDGQVINFSFAGDEIAAKKKENNYDCEAMLYFRDSLYLFTKRRADDYSALFVLPNTPGQHEARLIAPYKTDGLITDAAVSPSSRQVALIGYQDGHKKPFVMFFTGFTSNNFFTGSMKRTELKGGKKDWQMEGITYKNNDYLYFSCEQTKDVPATLYGVAKNKL